MSGDRQAEQNVEIGESSIHGKGAFARRAFKAGSIVLRWDLSKIISNEDLNLLPASERIYTHPFGENEILLVQPPERFVNHSCDNNTIVQDFCDVAIRDISDGEEITGDYSGDGSGSKFRCSCGGKNCRGLVG